MAAEGLVAIGVLTREVEEVYAGEDDEEAAEQRDGVDSRRSVEALEKQAGCDEGASGESHVVERVHAVYCQLRSLGDCTGRCAEDVHVGGELAESLVEVVHLGQNAADDHDDEDVGRRVRKLVLSSERHLERDSKGLDEHDGHGSGGGADGEVDKRVLAPVLGGDLVDHEDGEDGNECAVEEEA